MSIVHPAHNIHKNVLKILPLSSKALELSVFLIILLYMKDAKERGGIRAYRSLEQCVPQGLSVWESSELDDPL